MNQSQQAPVEGAQPRGVIDGLEPQHKAQVLLEALPWLVEFAGKTLVIKYGGNAMLSPQLQHSFAADVALMQHLGVRPVIVHGGGPQINELLAKLEIPSRFEQGMRVTDAQTLEAVQMVLRGQITPQLVSAINAAGGSGVGLSGPDAQLFQAAQRTNDEGEPVWGLVGEIQQVNTGFVNSLLAEGQTPVVSSLAVSQDDAQKVLNVNADLAAGALASALGAQKLIILTDVPGLYRNWPDTDSLIRALDVAELRDLLPNLDSGMIPKMLACLGAVEGGVGQAHIIDGRVEHSLLLEIFTTSGVGTMVTPAPATPEPATPSTQEAPHDNDH